MRWMSILLVAAVCQAAGCGDDRLGQVPTEAERLAATDLIEQVKALADLAEAPRQSSRLLQSATFAPVADLLAPDTDVLLPSRDVDVDLSGCVTATPRTASFTECLVAEHAVDGSVSRQAYQVTADLDDVFILGPDVHGAASIDARLDTGPGAVTGVLEVYGSWRAAGADSVLDATVRLDGVLLDIDGCPVGGAATIDGAVGANEQTSRTLWFGPTCGDLLISAR
jgi:hypothetical protein